MEIVINDPTYLGEQGDFEACRRQLLEELREIDETVSLTEDSLGRGADWPVFVAALGASVSALFLLGEKIEKNLDAWISLGQKLRRFLQTTAAKYGSTRLDPDAALLDLLAQIHAQEGPLYTVEVLARHVFPVYPLSWKPEGSFARNHDAVYLLAIRVNTNVIHVVTMKSNGYIVNHHRFKQDDWMSFFDEERERTLGGSTGGEEG